MKLSDKIDRQIDSSYNLSANEFAKSKMNSTLKVTNILSDIFNNKKDIKTAICEMQEYVNTFDSSDYSRILNSLDKYVIDNKLSLIQTLMVTKYLAKSCEVDEKYNESVLDGFVNILHNIENHLNSIDSYDEKINGVVKSIGHIVYRMSKDIGGLSEEYISKYDIQNTINNTKSDKSKIITEDASCVTIKSIANYSTSKYFPSLTNEYFSPSDYVNFMYGDNDIDYKINKIYKLDDYLKSILNTDTVEEDFFNIINYIINNFSHNRTAMNILVDKLYDCKAVLENDITDSYDKQKAIQSIIDKCNHIIDNIEDYLEGNINTIEDSAPLIEMGIGYIYDIIPQNTDDLTDDDRSVIKQRLNEAIDTYDVYNVLTESIKEFMKYDDDDYERFKRKQETKDELARQKMSDDYDFSKQKKQDKYEIKKQRKQEKYEAKQREKEEKRRKKEEEKEKHKNRTRTAWAKWKTIKLTTPAVYSAVRGLKRLLSAVAIGGVAYAAGYSATFLPIMYLITKYLKDKTFPSNEKHKIVLELRDAIKIIDEKINEAERKDDTKQKYQLMRMKEKLQTQYDNFNFTSTRGEML